MTNEIKNAGVKSRFKVITSLQCFFNFTVCFLDDDTVHEFKLYAVNRIGFGEPAIQVIRTKKRREKPQLLFCMLLLLNCY